MISGGKTTPSPPREVVSLGRAAALDSSTAVIENLKGKVLDIGTRNHVVFQSIIPCQGSFALDFLSVRSWRHMGS